MEHKIINNIKCLCPCTRKELIDFAISEKRILIAINAEKILHASPELTELINKNIGYPDGIGAVWALQKKGAKKVIKIPGCELWLDIINQHQSDKSFYLVGGTEETITKTIQRLREQFPTINICNYRNGYIQSESEKKDLIEDIVHSKPDVVFVAMGSPKQELLMTELYNHHKAVYQGLGGSFDVYTNTVKRAPQWWIKNNLEWLYRLLRQPSRIGRQRHLITFFVKLHLNRF